MVSALRVRVQPVPPPTRIALVVSARPFAESCHRNFPIYLYLRSVRGQLIERIAAWRYCVACATCMEPVHETTHQAGQRSSRVRTGGLPIAGDPPGRDFAT